MLFQHIPYDDSSEDNNEDDDIYWNDVWHKSFKANDIPSVSNTGDNNANKNPLNTDKNTLQDTEDCVGFYDKDWMSGFQI